MRRRVLGGWLGSLTLVLAGCGASARDAQRNSEPFECKERLASYVVSHHMGGDELGVQMDCQEAGPRIKRWRTDKKLAVGVFVGKAFSLQPSKRITPTSPGSDPRPA